MPKPFPDPSFNETVQLLQFTNTVTDNWMFKLFCIVAFSIIFISMIIKYKRVSDAGLTASFLTFLLSTFLWGMALIEGSVVVILLVLTMLFAIYAWLDE